MGAMPAIAAPGAVREAFAATARSPHAEHSAPPVSRATSTKQTTAQRANAAVERKLRVAPGSTALEDSVAAIRLRVQPVAATALLARSARSALAARQGPPVWPATVNERTTAPTGSAAAASELRVRRASTARVGRASAVTATRARADVATAISAESTSLAHVVRRADLAPVAAQLRPTTAPTGSAAAEVPRPVRSGSTA